jgi:hypothetical protein
MDPEIEQKLKNIRVAGDRVMEAVKGRDEPHLVAIRDLLYCVADLHDLVRRLAERD